MDGGRAKGRRLAEAKKSGANPSMPKGVFRAVRVGGEGMHACALGMQQLCCIKA